jgi:hypothetical protein
VLAIGDVLRCHICRRGQPRRQFLGPKGRSTNGFEVRSQEDDSQEGAREEGAGEEDDGQEGACEEGASEEDGRQEGDGLTPRRGGSVRQ